MRVSISAKRHEEIRSEVANLIEDWGIEEYPFSIWSLLQKMGIRVIPYSLLPEWLKVEVKRYFPNAITLFPPDMNPLKTIIFYNNEDYDRERIRFTLAHELAHLILQHPQSDDSIFEAEADNFAGYLLAPGILIDRYSQLNPSVIHKDFVVSYKCAKVVYDRTRNRLLYGSPKITEYEKRILDACKLRKGGGHLAYA